MSEGPQGADRWQRTLAMSDLTDASHVARLLADLTDSLAAGLGASAGILLLGAALALLQREPRA